MEVFWTVCHLPYGPLYTQLCKINFIYSLSLLKFTLRFFRIPKVNVITSSSEHVSDFDVSSDPSDCHSLPILDIPIYVSLVRIGSSFVIDATLQEEVCMYCRVLVGINGSGTICSVTKYGAGGVSPSGLLDMLKTAKSVGKRIIFRINEELSSNQV